MRLGKGRRDFGSRVASYNGTKALAKAIGIFYAGAIKVELFPRAARLFNQGIEALQHCIERCIIALLKGATRIVPTVNRAVLMAAIAYMAFSFVGASRVQPQDKWRALLPREYPPDIGQVNAESRSRLICEPFVQEFISLLSVENRLPAVGLSQSHHFVQGI